MWSTRKRSAITAIFIIKTTGRFPGAYRIRNALSATPPSLKNSSRSRSQTPSISSPSIFATFRTRLPIRHRYLYEFDVDKRDLGIIHKTRGTYPYLDPFATISRANMCLSSALPIWSTIFMSVPTRRPLVLVCRVRELSLVSRVTGKKLYPFLRVMFRSYRRRGVWLQHSQDRRRVSCHSPVGGAI